MQNQQHNCSKDCFSLIYCTDESRSCQTGIALFSDYKTHIIRVNNNGLNMLKLRETQIQFQPKLHVLRQSLELTIT